PGSVTLQYRVSAPRTTAMTNPTIAAGQFPKRMQPIVCRIAASVANPEKSCSRISRSWRRARLARQSERRIERPLRRRFEGAGMRALPQAADDLVVAPIPQARVIEIDRRRVAVPRARIARRADGLDSHRDGNGSV